MVYDGAEYWFEPDKLGVHIDDAANAGGDPSSLSEAVSKTDYNSLVSKFNSLLSRCEDAKIIASS